MCRTRAADTAVIVLECIVGRIGASNFDVSSAHRSLTLEKRCALKPDESAAHQGLTKALHILCQRLTNIFSRNELGQNVSLPQTTPFRFFRKYCSGRPLSKGKLCSGGDHSPVSTLCFLNGRLPPPPLSPNEPLQLLTLFWPQTTG